MPIRVLACILSLSLSSLLACDQVQEDSGKATDPSKAESDLPAPGFTLSDQTEGVLFTWVDAEGQFQLAEKQSDIPAGSRETVRVVVEGHSPGGSGHVFVADLREAGQDYPVRALARTDWESLGQAAREKRVAELRPPPPEPGDTTQSLGVDAIVYGAEWCKPCHLAEDYLKKKGAKVLKKDIEEDASAAKEMRGKLKAAGMSGSSIPVLDVGGTMLKGFSTGAIDAALKRAQKKPTLK